MSYTGVLFLIFLTLKLAGVVTWSWWLVTAPLWIGFAIFGVFAAILLLMGGTLKVISKGK